LSWPPRADDDFANAAQRLLGPSAKDAVRREWLARVDEQLEAEPEGSARAAALLVARSRLAAQISASTAHEGSE
jgi:hypothetical protein